MRVGTRLEIHEELNYLTRRRESLSPRLTVADSQSRHRRAACQPQSLIENREGPCSREGA